MAYYSSHYYDPPYESYHTSTDQYSSLGYDSNNDDHRLFGYDYDYDYNNTTPTPCYYEDSSPWSSSAVSYSVFNSSEPKFVEHCSYSPAVSTQFVISYSSAPDFNEPEFEEYDPTPYGGGYDIVKTYGQPLPPSHQTCYPNSSSSPGGGKGEIKPSLEKIENVVPAAAAVAVDEVQPKQQPQEEEDEDEDEEEDVDEEDVESSTDDSPRQETYGSYNPWDGPLPETQSGLEWDFDMSGRIFGYNCPCSCHNHSGCSYYGGHGLGESQYCANYLFGASPYPYEQGREHGGNYANPIFGYERHYQEQPLQVQVQYEDPSFFNISTHFI